MTYRWGFGARGRWSGAHNGGQGVLTAKVLGAKAANAVMMDAREQFRKDGYQVSAAAADREPAGLNPR